MFGILLGPPGPVEILILFFCGLFVAFPVVIFGLFAFLSGGSVIIVIIVLILMKKKTITGQMLVSSKNFNDVSGS